MSRLLILGATGSLGRPALMLANLDRDNPMARHPMHCPSAAARAITRGGCHEGTVHSVGPGMMGSEPNESLRGPCRLPVRYRVAGLLNGDAHTAWFQTLAGRRPHAELAHLRPFPARRTAASPLPFQWPSQQRSRTDPKPAATERLEARDIGCVITSGSSSFNR